MVDDINKNYAPSKRKGRPPLPMEVARQVRIVTFVTSTDKLLLDALADKRNSSMSAVCYELIAAGLAQQSITEQY